MSNEAEKSPKGLDVYANQVEINFGLYDFTLTFRIAGNDPDVAPATQAVVRMSPAHAKSVALLLNSTLEGYEKLINPIFLPPDLEADLSSRFSDEALQQLRDRTPQGDE